MTGGFGGKSRASVHFPFAAVVLVALIGFLRIAMQHWRQGSVLIGVALVLAAVLRALLTNEQAGLLAIRSRAIDILLYGGLGVVIVVVAMTITRGPF
ncbi:Protein of unknown function (DUF3017) [Saccharopolyspora erythraea NRRL 2338]|uniref:Uncharacterized protein n=2 Tax=Saccharopolyspora erythraea TaxID=1836 RepID=A4FP41_SACEN|nr:DUF3017 domain-containing protein [Saccharopolyspora erythraea]EQD81660.1 hypothetical protein N599_34920 [Saccharopolyspora erythraea D]PFG99457.1 Protein of unknown function (DUF3017) [Saccharopolyspora erythraea NRRL 2338]QRK89366.1 DUF3017 domain-containing protein [Saccharopolyspora erythraea]CAM05816.1 hypothetical protein SACE_6650 [Saccharopolyspora erythraea NRRL 2338]